MSGKREPSERRNGADVKSFLHWNFLCPVSVLCSLRIKMFRSEEALEEELASDPKGCKGLYIPHTGKGSLPGFRASCKIAVARSDSKRACLNSEVQI